MLDKELIDRSLKLRGRGRRRRPGGRGAPRRGAAILAKFQAEVERWDSQVKRLQREVDRTVVAPQILLESKNQLKSSSAARDAAKATIMTAQADLLSKQADAAKAKVDVGVARAGLAVAESEEKRLEAWVGYLTLTAPFDGVDRGPQRQHRRLRPAGDRRPHGPRPLALPVARRRPRRSTWSTAPTSSASSSTFPSRTPTTSGSGRRRACWSAAFRDKELPATVTRTSWALNVKSRTLRAEIDLHNTDSQILPGMYAYGKVIIERPNVRALPRRRSSTAATRPSAGGTRTARRCGPRSRRASATASGSRSPTAGRSGGPARSLDADRRLGAGDPRRPVDPHRGRGGAGRPGGRDQDGRRRREGAVVNPRPPTPSSPLAIWSDRMTAPRHPFIGRREWPLAR